MRSIRIPNTDWDKVEGVRAVHVVIVNWPELRLTADQHMANAHARVYGYEEPYEDNCMFMVEIER